jgi:hypothetical protein
MLAHSASAVHPAVQYPFAGPAPKKSFEVEVKQVRPAPHWLLSVQLRPTRALSRPALGAPPSPCRSGPLQSQVPYSDPLAEQVCTPSNRPGQVHNRVVFGVQKRLVSVPQDAIHPAATLMKNKASSGVFVRLMRWTLPRLFGR